MSTVRFATLCDHCGKRSMEYSVWASCEECLSDTCPECAVTGSYDEDETGSSCLCVHCEAAEAAQNGQAVSR